MVLEEQRPIVKGERGQGKGREGKGKGNRGKGIGGRKWNNSHAEYDKGKGRGNGTSIGYPGTVIHSTARTLSHHSFTLRTHHPPILMAQKRIVDVYALKRRGRRTRRRKKEKRRKNSRSEKRSKSTGVCVGVSDAFVQERLIQARPSAVQKGEKERRAQM